MKIHTLAATVILIALVTLTGVADTGAFQGSWEVDVDRTLEYARQSPKYDPAQDKHFENAARRMLGTMTIDMDTEKLTFRRGQKQQAFPYEVVRSSDDSVVLQCEASGQTFEVTLKEMGPHHMNLKSSATDDLDYYVWKRK